MGTLPQPKPKFEKGHAPVKKPMCWNCQYASKGFKWGNMTHHSCHHPETQKRIEDGEHPYGAIMQFSDKCDKHEFKIKL